ncbi:LPXTG cell wall anchor domain-containing protein [Mycetocola tolaasinivorans]|uniref:LPXTG cell wall anchor domain-containing protein n=1 Tax=Mycetocola tolaasinivorans TaxID=76635 RepID=A0A3L7A364_9MICO|nr:LPXTG cell wall anchor domain-containing protein [Mycetocola tolaasinivorans]RLP74534.1 LPXTG cell wall anchor domain-containing protein [Mycetocola tolaasinivorans]
MSLRRIVAGGALALALTVAVPTVALASPADRSIELTGSGHGEIGDMFGAQLLIPGSRISADFNVVRRGGGVSSLSMEMLADLDPKGALGQAALVTVRTPLAEETSVLGDLLLAHSTMDLGTGSEQVTPVHLEIALPAESGNGTMARTVPFRIRVTAQDRTATPEVIPAGHGSVGNGSGWLSETGSNTGVWPWIGGITLVIGAAALIVARRRRSRD